MKECKNCEFNNEYGYCECSSMDKWYACPIENKKPENIKALEEYGKQTQPTCCGNCGECKNNTRLHCIFPDRLESFIRHKQEQERWKEK